ncbi:cobyrinate a,c-diamide synthase [Actinoplanes italicus]|uniref:cobyrinate a,c-diamide synthase n=1 Tax=Actinoplanes italicus TaxID=113567 RepID=UPI0024AE985C|nr:cobyrinate a,c-diamide synthase [Actinoplanes italicus]
MSAPSSGHGKTAIAVGLLAALSGRGIPAAGFKVGPDHTDAAYLGLAAGRPGRNLDPRLVGAQRVAPLFAHGASGSQVAVIEGAMGLFDSLTGQPEIDGTASVAAALRAPVVLVVDVAAMGHSLAALVHGFRMFDEMVHLGGVILNRVASDRHEQMLRSAMDDIGMPVLGALHRGDLPNALPPRTHGLVPVAHRTVEAGRAVRRLGEAVAGSLDMERLMALAASAPPIPGPLWTPAEAAGDVQFDQRPVIALAGGQGAPYTYVETAELLTAAGADVAVVDPLRDEALPPGTRALVVGAGLPEGYAEELSANRRLCSAVAQFARDGWPVIAEGIALPWLGHELDGRPMCGVLDATATTGEQTVAGYREATAPGTSVLAPAGARITGYKQHRAVVAPRAGSNPAWTWSGGNPEGFVWRQVHASQLGLHWAAAPEIARRLVAAAHAGPQGASAGQNGMTSGPPPGMPQGPPMGMPPGMPPLQPVGMPPMQSMPVSAGMPPGPGSPAMPPQGVSVGPPAGMMAGQGPMPGAGPQGPDFPGHGMPGSGGQGPDFPGHGMPGSGGQGPDFPGHGMPGSGGQGPDFPGHGMPGSGGQGPDFPGHGMPGSGGQGPDFPGHGTPGQGHAGPGHHGYGPGEQPMPVQGMPISPGVVISGQVISGEFINGQVINGQVVDGGSMQPSGHGMPHSPGGPGGYGQPMPGSPGPGHAMPGSPGPGHAMPGSPGPGHGVPGSQGPGNGMPGGPGQGQSMPGVPGTGQQMPGGPGSGMAPGGPGQGMPPGSGQHPGDGPGNGPDGHTADLSVHS